MRSQKNFFFMNAVGALASFFFFVLLELEKAMSLIEISSDEGGFHSATSGSLEVLDAEPAAAGARATRNAATPPPNEVNSSGARRSMRVRVPAIVRSPPPPPPPPPPRAARRNNRSEQEEQQLPARVKRQAVEENTGDNNNGGLFSFFFGASFPFRMVDALSLSSSFAHALFRPYIFKTVPTEGPSRGGGGGGGGAPDISDDVNDLENLSAQVRERKKDFFLFFDVVGVASASESFFVSRPPPSLINSLSFSKTLHRSTATTSRPPRRSPRSRPARGPRRW